MYARDADEIELVIVNVNSGPSVDHRANAMARVTMRGVFNQVWSS